MDDRERGTETKVAGKANVVERVGYTVYVRFEKVCTDLLRATSVRHYETLPSTKGITDKFRRGLGVLI